MIRVADCRDVLKEVLCEDGDGPWEGLDEGDASVVCW
jgi:hypothetical protein